MINEHILEDTGFVYILFHYKLHIIDYLASACITMKAGLLIRVSKCCKYAYCLGPIVRHSAYANCCLFAHLRLSLRFEDQPPAQVLVRHRRWLLRLRNSGLLVCRHQKKNVFTIYLKYA